MNEGQDEGSRFYLSEATNLYICFYYWGQADSQKLGRRLENPRAWVGMIV